MKKNLLAIFVVILFFCSNITTVNSLQLKKQEKNLIQTLNRLEIKGNLDENLTYCTSYDNGYRFNIQGWIYVSIKGNPYDRGFQYGYLLSNEIIDMMNRWNDLFPNPLSWVIQRGTIMRLFWPKYPEELKQEIHGIADGIKEKDVLFNGREVSYKDIIALNEMFELKTRGKIYTTSPLYDLIYGIPGSDYEEYPDSLGNHNGHCSAFIATGNATVDGNIVATQASWGNKQGWGFWNHYLGERYNVILDIQPTEGYRILMTTAPGYIWSMEDYYQNDAGMILMETTISGMSSIWNRFGDPISVRLRKAIQYCDSIDGIVDCLINKNNGLYICDWMIGDIKTGEIASLELGLRNQALKRTKNGFYWSCNSAKDTDVIREINSILGFGIIASKQYRKLTGKIFLKGDVFVPNNRDIKFKELKNEFYGKIDVNCAKHIMSTYPLYDLSFDTKITDSEMMKDLGFWTFMGSPDGSCYNLDSDKNYSFNWEVRNYTDMPACGWVEIYGKKDLGKEENNIRFLKPKDIEKTPVWIYNCSKGEYGNAVYSDILFEKDTLYFTPWNGNITALNSEDGSLIWETDIGNTSTSQPVINKEDIFVGSNKGIYKVNKSTGNILWNQPVGVVSSAAFSDKHVFCGSNNGFFYCFNKSNGDIIWSYNTSDKICSSPVLFEDLVLFGSNNKKVYAFYHNNGTLKWSFETDGPVCSDLVICKNNVLFGSWDQNLYFVNISNGKDIWKNSFNWGVNTKPMVKDDVIYLGSVDNNIYAINSTNGDIIWAKRVKAAIQSTPINHNEKLYFGCDDGRVYCIDSNDGSMNYTYAPSYHIDSTQNYVTQPIVSKPIIDNDKLFFGSTNGKIYCINI